jgi:hypothetical protein
MPCWIACWPDRMLSMMTWRGLALQWAACLALCSPAVAGEVVAAQAVQAVVCASQQAAVRALRAEDRQDACEGAGRAIAFFAGHGLKPTHPLVIEVTNRMAQEAGPTAVGCYLEQRDQILMLDYAAFKARRTWFKLPIDRELYRSLAAHESAHAIAACNFGIPRPSIQAKEYLAYVAMFASMPPALRERVLKAMPGEGFENEDRITAVFYMFDPMRFGAEAWRHYLKPENGARFLQAVLAGRSLPD